MTEYALHCGESQQIHLHCAKSRQIQPHCGESQQPHLHCERSQQTHLHCERSQQTHLHCGRFRQTPLHCGESQQALPERRAFPTKLPTHIQRKATKSVPRTAISEVLTGIRPPFRLSELRAVPRPGRRGESQIFDPPLTSKTALVFEIRGTFSRAGSMAPHVCAGRRPTRTTP